ncbi:hypothetical protein GAY29_06560 [Azospirillum brasilense]|uniref:sacsin N-terminal ATP-binding-like domain-containing protein n=1 Tax=Azospirillum brasilense TaxID=192 RepID=UPI00190D99C3|nr:hypothetical protein [Azospirillum brasilense]MBK3732776.1 hypothetical protein [Azospirillum brasilense]
MGGYREDVLSHVNLIADNLRDRYANGFPILKELVQNADDAPATAVDFVLTDGIAEADNPLLRSAALVCINDGPFLQRHARGIVHIGLGSKAADQAAIGKFGLGQKSVFHLCEAFFFMASADPGEDCGDYRRRDVLNPWSGQGRDPDHPDWDLFSNGDQARIERLLSPALPAAPWFVLWLPLRTTAHQRAGGGVIIEHYPALAELDRLLSDAAPLAALLPGLRGIQRIRYLRQTAGQGLQQVREVALAEESARLPRPTESQPADLGVLKGEVTVSGAGLEPSTMVFAGRDVLLRPEQTDGIRNSEFWPRIPYRDPVTGRGFMVPEKALPQGAAILTRSVARGTGRLAVRWAVFLPVGETPCCEAPCPGDFDYELSLHGYFFVDSGRRTIEALDAASAAALPSEGERAVRARWNTLVRDRATLPSVPAAIHALAKAKRMARDDIRTLCRALRNTPFFAQHAAALCAENQFVLMATRDGQEWRKVPAGTAVRALPEPPEGAAARPWSALPALDDVPEGTALTWHGAPNLLHPASSDAWTAEEVARLFDERAVAAFRSRSSVEYLAAFLEQNPAAAKAAVVRAALVHLLRLVLVEAGPGSLTRAKAGSASIVALLAPGSVLFLKQVTQAEVYRALAGTEAHALVLPDELRRDGIEAAGPAFRPGDAIPLLRCLDALVRENAGVAEEAARAAEQILAAATAAGASLIAPDIRDLKVIRAWRAASGRREALSIGELMERADHGTLFRDRNTGNLDLARAKRLQSALPGADVVIVRPEAADLLKPRDVPAVSGPSMLDAVGRATRFGEAAVRRALFEDLLSDCDPVGHARTLRLLLHGDAGRASDTSLLWGSVDGAWGGLAEQLLAMNGEAWRLIAEDLVEQLSGRQLQALGIRTLAGQDVEAMLDRCTDGELARLQLSAKQRKTVLDMVESEALWKRLPFHETVDGTLTAIDALCFEKGTWPVSRSMAARLKLLRDADGIRASAMRERLVARWSPLHQVRLCLAAHSPAVLYREVLQALCQPDLDHLPEALVCQLRAVAWLPLQDTSAAAPREIFDLPKAVAEAAMAALAQHGQAFRTPAALPREIAGHPALQRHADRLFSGGGEALVALSQLLAGAPGLRIAFASGSGFPVESAVQIDALDDVPGWRLLRAVAEAFGTAEAERHVVPALSGSLAAAEIVPLLGRLARAHEAAGRDEASPALRLFDYYFDGLSVLPGWGDALAAIPLRNALGEWRGAGELTAEVENIDPAHVVHTRYRTPLRQPQSRPGHAAGGHGNPHESLHFDAGEEERAAELLEDYFADWANHVSPQALGVLIGLFGRGPGVRALAESYLTPRTQEWIVDTIKGLNLYGWETFAKTFGAVRPVVRVQRGSHATVVSLTGEDISVPLSALQDDSTIFVGRPRNARLPGGGQATVLTLKRIPLSGLAPARIGELLRQSAEYLLDEVYVFHAGERASIVDALFGAAADDGQADISAARASIVDHIEVHLRQLGAAKHLSIRDHVRAIEAAEARKNEAPPQDRQACFQELQSARESLAAHIENDNAACTAVLESVRRRLAKYQYHCDRVPFEFFQNADDAAVELAAMTSAMGLEAGEDPLPSQARRFCMEIGERSLRLIHWGRPINYFVARGFDGKARGFHLDLRKMLSIGHSDKEGGSESTGEFGLGFKSVHLVTSRPAFVSRLLKAEVVGGMIPRRHNGGNVGHHWGDRAVPPTVFDLPLDSGVAPGEVVREFERLHGILPAFARAIRSIEITGGSASAVHWMPAPVSGIAGACVGSVRVPEARGALRSARALRLSQGETALLLAIGARGFESLPDSVPTIWRTAPTREEWRAGYCVNGPFEVDVGRTQLPPDSDGNQALVERMGEALGAQLLALHRASLDDWPALADVLGLSADPASRDELWVSLWEVLSKGFASEGGRLLRSLHGDGRGLSRLASERPAIPTGLAGPFRRLVPAHAVRGQASGLLADPELQEAAARWPWLAAWLDQGAVVSRDVAIRLGQMGFDEPGPVRLADVLRAATEDGVVPPALADALGALLTREWIEERTEPAERAALREVLGRLAFRARTGEAVAAGRLVAGEGSEPESGDERRRAQFAPEGRVLAADYDAAGRAFFALCRGDLQAPADELATWAAAAGTDGQRLAVLAYILDGDLGHAVAERLRRPSSGFWLASRDAVMESPLLVLWDEPRRWTLATRLFPPARSEVLSLHALRPVETLDPATHLEFIWDWWQTERERWTAWYESEAYPDGAPPQSLATPETADGRRDWLVLLALGSLMRMGRTQRGQHRRFIEICEKRGWWDVFAGVDPRDGADRWLDVLENFADLQVQDETFAFWMREFATIHRFARWLPVYAQIFLRLGARREAFDLSVVLAPRADPALTGAGGVDAPPISRSLGLGACFVVRELNRLDLVTGPLTHPYCFAPTASVRRLLERFGFSLSDGEGGPFAQSRAIHEFLVSHLGPDRATFAGDFDLPLVVLADYRNVETQTEVLGAVVADEEEDDEPLSVEIPGDDDVDVALEEEAI